MFLCSPNNPTGLIESPEVLDAAVDASNGLVVVDEAYGQFSSWSAVDRVTDDGQVVVVRTFSKTWAMAALRLGYAIAPANVVAALDAVVLPYHLDAIKQAAGVLAFEFKAEMEARVAAIKEERGRLLQGMTDLDVDVWPSQSNFILFRPHRRRDRRVATAGRSLRPGPGLLDVGPDSPGACASPSAPTTRTPDSSTH